ncbi:acyl-ACP--UDP-N-acetylglucosamine O-acyltransferase [Marinobacterium jannaschii]|uniref:acyl-ACP--UDP-N-acetylglucosamine O-acyltransferase n=1 Tax=Marinobacterium jannaschii TaxID=64970 RepID=UPI000480F04F|nr:acyl-ACP--UDP-N-acetylglucosamine O-acyltransferase [Marinobacterium jannaschii]
MIDSRAIVDPAAKIAADVEIGPFSIIGPDVEIDSGTVIGPHAVVRGPTRIGKNNRIFQFTSVGEDCQDKKYAGEPTELVIGDNNVIREGVTIHRGTVQDNSITIIGSNNLFMANAHVAHDCVIGDNIIMANNVAVAGHVHVGDWAILGGFTAVHQFCHIGAHVMCGAGSVVLKDIPAYVMANGNSAQPHGINSEGLKRRGYSADSIMAIKRAYKVIYRQKLTLEQAVETLQEMAVDVPELEPMISVLQASNRGIIR